MPRRQKVRVAGRCVYRRAGRFCVEARGGRGVTLAAEPRLAVLGSSAGLCGGSATAVPPTCRDRVAPLAAACRCGRLLQNRGFQECVLRVPFRARFRLNATCGFIGAGRPGKCATRGAIPENSVFAAGPAEERSPLGRGPHCGGDASAISRGRRAKRRDLSDHFLVNISRAWRDGAGCEEVRARWAGHIEIRTRWGGVRRGPGAGGRMTPGASVRGGAQRT